MYDELVKRLREDVPKVLSNFDFDFVEDWIKVEGLIKEAADVIEELSKRLNSVTAERDAAMKRLCEWCGVGCSMENRRAELCEIASVGLAFLAEEGE